ncbi:MAG: trifunctional transcriptional activator/DNA repair protein Ada/methylated-DNA--[protein]-cysteine S-methyltransferase [Pseudomonadota bacterium]
MLFDLPNDDVLYDALVRRDPAYDGFAFVAVKSTGVFCRLVCPARNPKRENSVFYDSVAACLAAGYRPCKRCRPLAPAGEADPLVKSLTEALERDPARRWRETDLVALGHDPSTVRRAFKRHFGITFLDMARLRRLGSASKTLSSGEPVIQAQLEAGFESASGFRAAFGRLLGQPPAGLRGRSLLTAAWIETPIGPMVAIADQHALHLLEFFERKALPAELKRLQETTRSGIAIGPSPLIDRLKTELAQYFDGRLAAFSVPLARQGSDFTRQVWDRLRALPVGETRSYSEIAADIGRPAAVRAVARANGANPIAIVVPCHRIIGANGDLTGYGGGLWRKRWLLEHERRAAAHQQDMKIAG